MVAGIGAFMIASAPGAHAALGPGAFFFNAWCLATPAVVWMLARLVFREGASPTVAHFAAAGVLVAATMAGDYGRLRLGALADFPGAAQVVLLAGRAAALALLFGACAMAAAHWRADLVEERRRARAAFIGVVGAVFAALAGSEFVFGGRGAPLELLLAGHSLLLLLAFALLQAVARGELAALLAAPVTRHAPLAIVRSDGVEARLAERVLEEMALGYRNFNDFLHDYRLREVAARLADPKEAHLPVLSLALDCGYGSIGPFNRAFKAKFGMTPTRFRGNRPDIAHFRQDIAD